MDGREAMSLSGSPSYYMHRGVSGSGTGTGTQIGGFNVPPGFRSSLNPGVSGQSIGHGNTIGSTFSVEQQPSQANFPRVNNVGGASSEVPTSGEIVKKKRGRPRKYGPDGAVSLGLSPMSVSPSMESLSPTLKKGRGRPPGSGRKQQLASLGGWMNSSAGLAFAPHVIFISVGEDIASKILSFSQQKPRALCILSASGTVSAVTLRQPASGSAARYEGRFEILCLSGSYLVAEDGGSRERTGGLNVSLSSPEGHVFGGVVGGMLIASSPVQVVACSFVYGGSKTKEKTSPNAESSRLQQAASATPTSVAPNQNLTPASGAGSWPSSRPIDLRNPHTGIDLTRG